MAQSWLVHDRFDEFNRAQWSELRDTTPLTLTAADIEALRGINDALDIDEVAEIYLPLSRLLNLHVAATQRLSIVTDTFLRTPPEAVPYVIGIGGSVAVGKSTTARVLRTLLANWEDHPNVALVTTDGFLLPNQELERRGLMERKGFPESYDTAALVNFLQEVKSGKGDIDAPVYSHLRYDVVPEQAIRVDKPDVLIVEGLNVLQGSSKTTDLMVSDFFDFSIYVDADRDLIKAWYIERFLSLRSTVFDDPQSYFVHYSHLDDDAARLTAETIWETINAPNLRRNIEPTRDRATCVLTKSRNHRIENIRLRKS